jgi:glucan phosphoethanolaminetransferase (alkaline phosphatase superfamily)
MSEVVRLVERVNCIVVVTADHGEHLGEKGRYLHEEDSEVVRKVPWLVVNESEIGIKSNRKEFDNRYTSHGYTGAAEEVEDHLRNLGYK